LKNLISSVCEVNIESIVFSIIEKHAGCFDLRERKIEIQSCILKAKKKEKNYIFDKNVEHKT
jgi:hypothetical protein